MLRSLLPYLAYAYLSVVGRTSRIRWEGLEHLKTLQGEGPGFIYAFWHSRQALFTYTHRGCGASVLVSRSRDGELIAGVMRLSRIGAVRGSSSRAALTATRELLDAASSGTRLGITPDGPKGPAGEVKIGVLYLARKAGLPILPISNASSRNWVLKRSWDGFQIPLPFAKSCVIHGPPIRVGPQDDLSAKAAELKESLDRITQEAERLCS